MKRLFLSALLLCFIPLPTNSNGGQIVRENRDMINKTTFTDLAVDKVDHLSKEIEETINKIEMQKRKEGKEVNSYLAFLIITREAHEEVFKNNGYCFSEILSDLVSAKFNKNNVLYQKVIQPLVVHIYYGISEAEPDFATDPIKSLNKIYDKSDAENIFRLWIAFSAENPKLDSPDYDVFSVQEIDSLLRKKWEYMRKALNEGNIDKALDYFIGGKEGPYNKILGLSQEVTRLLKNIESKDLELLTSDSHIEAVKYVIASEIEIKGVKKKVGSYVIFERDEKDGLWKISFF